MKKRESQGLCGKMGDEVVKGGKNMGTAEKKNVIWREFWRGE